MLENDTFIIVLQASCAVLYFALYQPSLHVCLDAVLLRMALRCNEWSLKVSDTAALSYPPAFSIVDDFYQRSRCCWASSAGGFWQ